MFHVLLLIAYWARASLFISFNWEPVLTYFVRILGALPEEVPGLPCEVWFLNIFLITCTMYPVALEYIGPQSWGLDFSLMCSKILRVLYVTNFLSYVLDFGGPKVNS